MTRGSFVLFTPDRAYISTEFNGDMYFDGHGEDAARGIKDVKTKEDLLDFAKKFNREHHNYPDTDIQIYHLASDEKQYEEVLNTTEKYYDNYFSDYIFIKNMSGSDLNFTTKDGQMTLPDETSGVLYFGHYADDFPEELDGFKANDTDLSIPSIKEYSVDLSIKNINEIKALMKDNNYTSLDCVYDSTTSFAESEMSEFVDDWVLPYIDFDRYYQDIKDTMEDRGIFELETGEVVCLS